MSHSSVGVVFNELAPRTNGPRAELNHQESIGRCHRFKLDGAYYADRAIPTDRDGMEGGETVVSGVVTGVETPSCVQGKSV